MSLETAFKKLGNALEDLSSLEVRTYTGDIKTFLSEDETAENFKKLVSDNVAAGTLELKLYTRLDADGDSDHFFASGNIDETMLKSHVEAFKMGQDIRRAYIELFKDVAQKLL